MINVSIFKRLLFRVLIFSLFLFLTLFSLDEEELTNISLSEHPRPDFKRDNWINLNGIWNFRFDSGDKGMSEEWYSGRVTYSDSIKVPFPWGSPLSGVEDKADIAWYSMIIQVPEFWKGKRVFLVIGACDWYTTAWLDGKKIGEHKGGYTPFEFEITHHVEYNKKQNLVIRVDDTPHPFKLEGKQGYGPARGIWQTTYLEARGSIPFEWIHFSPDIHNNKVRVDVKLMEPSPEDLNLKLDFIKSNRKLPSVTRIIPGGYDGKSFELLVPDARLWSLQDPFLYEVKATLSGEGIIEDQVKTYFGMREISVVKIPVSDYSYIALNDEPIYLKMALDQAFHPEGYYTFPTDDFMREEIMRAHQIGLNGIRIHVKVGIPRKLYWADRLGMLIMADVPNSWGEPTKIMKEGVERALYGMIRRDYNHPSIFSWVLFNETWGLKSGKEKIYTKETQDWVASLYRLAKSLDPTRLIEDNSPNLGDHVVTDINSWHNYLPGYVWKEKLDNITENSFPGSNWNFVEGRMQGDQPLFNSECGNVWGYEGSTGDIDWSWDYHNMINEFRAHPKICGWIYTELHDVVNEWNGYYRYDRSEKITGLSELVEGMTLRDLHTPLYIVPNTELCKKVEPGKIVKLPLMTSFMTDNIQNGEELILRIKLDGWNTLGQRETYYQSSRKINFEPWMFKELSPMEIPMPNKDAITVLSLVVENKFGEILHRNFTTYLVLDKLCPRDTTLVIDNHNIRVLRFAPNTFYKSNWSLKQWNVLNGLKVNGAGPGFFECRISWPKGLDLEEIEKVTFLVELSAKQLYGKDKDDSEHIVGDFMLGKGTHDPGLNPNSYPMTDTLRFPSFVNIYVGGKEVGTFKLKDDPADHRGILSWYSQKQDGYLREAGSYGELIAVEIPKITLMEEKKNENIIIRLEVKEEVAGGLAIYGGLFGRYPLDPTFVFLLKD